MSNALERVKSYVDDGAVPLDVIQMLQRPHKGLDEISLRVSDLRALIAALEKFQAWADTLDEHAEILDLDPNRVADHIRATITEVLQ